jgi:hypothetical protein
MAVRARCWPAALLVAALGAAPAARAQEPEDDVIREPPPPPVYVAELRAAGRAVIGLDFGIGVLDAVCDGCYSEGGLSLDGFGGVQITPRLALLVDAWALMHLVAGDRNQTGGAAHALATAGPRVWIDPRLWVQAGLGAGGLLATGAGARSGADFGPAAMLAVGGEPGHRRCSGIDLSVRIGATRVAGEALDADSAAGDTVLLYSIAAVVGFHWN